MQVLLLATRNPNKVREYEALLQGLPYHLLSLKKVPSAPEVEETEGTFEENAALKAKTAAQATGLMALGEDSGLEVDALDGEPGVRTARYAGPGATDEQRIRYLLAKLQGVPLPQRTARFRCVIAIAEPEGAVHLCQGVVEGHIALEPKGSNGWGYDPVFYLREMGRTMAELSSQEKNAYSHRGRAALQARGILLLLAGSTGQKRS